MTGMGWSEFIGMSAMGNSISPVRPRHCSAFFRSYGSLIPRAARSFSLLDALWERERCFGGSIFFPQDHSGPLEKEVAGKKTIFHRTAGNRNPLYRKKLSRQRLRRRSNESYRVIADLSLRLKPEFL